MVITRCNFCEKEFNWFDNQEKFGIHRHVGYGSKFDGDEIMVDLCCECFDVMMDEYILPHCVLNPIKRHEI